jgi:spore germination cell wall hydrolase CwlJ-like protein
MYNTRSRILIIGALIAITSIALSLSFNIKHFFEIKYYQALVSNIVVITNTTEKSPTVTTNITSSVAVNKNELQCLAENIYFESASQSLAGKFAVGHVVLNRMTSSKYPKTACGVINQKVGNTCMFSWTCNERRQIRSQFAWEQSRQVAMTLLSRKLSDLVDITDGATHFHATSVNPKWKLKKVAKIDDHLFYK